MPSYEQSYLGRLRKLIGREKIFAISARGIIRDKKGHVLLVRRSDNGRWVMPAGSIELEESVEDCLKREVREEAGLEVVSARLIAVYSHPRFSFVTAYGDPYQMLSLVFVVDEWKGEIVQATDETTGAAFFPLDALPENLPPVYHETLADLREFEATGQVIVK